LVVHLAHLLSVPGGQRTAELERFHELLRILLRGSVNRRVALVSRDDRKAVESL